MTEETPTPEETIPQEPTATMEAPSLTAVISRSYQERFTGLGYETKSSVSGSTIYI